MLTRKKVQTSILLVIGILLLINFLASRFFFRLDYTEDQRYSLSKATKDILTDLNEPVTISAYFSENLPPDIEKVRQDFRDMLVEYASNSGGLIVYEFINPSVDQQTEMKAQQSGIRPIMINVRERDQVKQQRAYLGAVLQMGDRKEVIPFIQPGAAMEYALSTNIKKLAVKEKPAIALLQGHGEPTLSALNQLNEQLSVLYTVEPLEFSDTSGVPSKYRTLVVIAPKDTVPELHFRYLDDFLNRGGRLLLALNAVEGNLSKGMGEKIYTGFEDWLKQKGIELENSFVIDANCSNVTVRQQQGYFVMNTPVKFPYLPIITNFTKHPITEGLESVVLPFASPIKLTSTDTSVIMFPLAVTSKKSGVENPPLYFDAMKQWAASDFPLSSQPVAVIVEGKLPTTSGYKMIVFGDGDFAVNGEGQSAQQLGEDNISLMSNAIDWLSDDTGLIELRTKGVTSRPLDPSLEDSTKTLLKYLNFLLPIILVIFYGVFRFQLKRKIRNQLMTTDYVSESKQ
jgi:gliding-associated putative ABC transporter substrate-binding component GldG